MSTGISFVTARAVVNAAGVYQFDIVVPSSAADGDLPVTISIEGVTSPDGTFITVQH